MTIKILFRKDTEKISKNNILVRPFLYIQYSARKKIVKKR